MIKNDRDIIIACDFQSVDELNCFLIPFYKENIVPFLKIGMELFYSCDGGKLITNLKNKGHDIFLDLKLYDIPNTVHKTIKVLEKYEPNIISIHASGGIEMMKSANKALTFEYNPPIMAGVTLLTSFDESTIYNELLFDPTLTLKSIINKYIKNAYLSGMDAIICSVNDVINIKNKIDYYSVLKTICPGIRLECEDDDQKRVATPEEAKKAGVNYIVVGREITQDKNPLKKYMLCKEMFLEK